MNIEIDEIQTESLKEKKSESSGEFPVGKKKVQKVQSNSQNEKKRKSFPGQYLSNEGHDSDVVLPVLKNFKSISYDELEEKHLESLSISESLEISMVIEK